MIITIATASPRAIRSFVSSATNGLRSIAISPAMMKSRRTAPAALSTMYAPTTASGSSTNWTQRGTTTGAMRAGGAGVGDLYRLRILRAGLPRSASGLAASSSVCEGVSCAI